MFNRVRNWLDDRTGWRATARRWKNRPVPGRGRIAGSLGFALAATLLVEFITGLLISLVYSPSTGSAWGSVYYLSNHVDLGWLVRGVHRFGSYALVVLGVLWLARLVFAGLFHRPREFTWWLAVGVVALIFALGVTGNILPWDQRGYWAAVVETTIAGGLPGIGPALRGLVVGGSEFGNSTLTRIHAIHVLILPGLLVALGALRLRLLRRVDERPEAIDRHCEPFWPRTAFVNLAAATLSLAIVVGYAVAYRGYPLDAPADPGSDDYPARPEWYFLPLYQLLRVFQGREVIATVILPAAVALGLLALPLLDRIFSRRLTRIAASTFFVTLGACSTYLTYQALSKDAHSAAFHAARAKADGLADRAILLADRDGVPPEGSAYLLKLDPATRGRDLFAAKCQGCHNFDAPKGEGQWAPAMAHYGSRAWVRGLLEKPDAPAYFGLAPQCGGMAEWKESSELDAKQLDAVADYVAAMARTPADMTPGEWLADPANKDHPGRAPYQAECAQCHTFGDPALRDKKLQPAPDMFAWGSDRWTARMIRQPGHESLYGYLEEEQKMPAFGSQLTQADLDTLVRYLRGEPPAPAVPEPEEGKVAARGPAGWQLGFSKKGSENQH